MNPTLSGGKLLEKRESTGGCIRQMVDEAELWYARAHFKLGEAYRARGQLKNARVEYERSVAISPQYYEGYIALGETCLTENDLDGAMECFQRAKAIRSDDPLLHVKLGRVFLGKGRDDHAVAEFSHALSKDPENPGAHYSMGHLYLKKKEHEKAVSHFEKTLSDRKLRRDAQICIGIAQTKLGRYEDATAILREVLREDPENVMALDAISKAYRSKGMEYEAVKYFRRAVSIKAKPHGSTGILSAELGALGDTQGRAACTNAE